MEWSRERQETFDGDGQRSGLQSEADDGDGASRPPVLVLLG